MMIKAVLIHEDGRKLGHKSVPEDCRAIRYGGATFVLDGAASVVPYFVYRMTDTYHFNNLDQQ